MTFTNPSVVFTEPGQVVVEDLPIPEPASGQLLLRTSKSMISPGTELTMLSGDCPPESVWARLSEYPLRPGYISISEVVDAGEGVDKSWVGRRVANFSPHGRYAATPLSMCFAIPEGVEDESACLFVFALIAMNGIRRASLAWGESVAIYGMGLVGQLASRFCVLAGARPTFAIDLSDRRLALAGDGVIPINPSRQDVRGSVEEANSGRLVDVVFEVTGNADLFPTEMNVLRPVGRFVVISSPRKATNFNFHDLCNGPSYTIIGAHNWSHPEHATSLNPWTMARHVELFFDLIKDGRLEVGSLVTHRVSGLEAPSMYRMLREDASSSLGVVLDWQ